MSRHWGDIRRQARAWRAELLERTGGDPSAEAILVAAAAATGLKSVGLVTGHPTLGDARAVLDVEASRVWFAKDVGDEAGRVLRAHEYAHARLHASHSARCTEEDIQGEASEDGAPLGIGPVEGYGPDERREREANVYAQELLLPSDALRRWFVDEGLGATAIAVKVGLPAPMVAHHLAFALLVSDLLPDVPPPAPPAPPAVPASTACARSVEEAAGAGGTSANEAARLDESQREAAHVAAGPALVVAGPGTGKTRTLVARIVHLLGRGVAPEHILALTYSNKAAEEMRERVAAEAPADVTKLTIATFHAFGLELLRKHGTRIGLPPRPALLAPVDALLLLEQDLVALGLDYYQNLWDPAIHLRDILGAISRAKDEVAGPERYAALAAAMAAAASDDEAAEAAAKAVEVARVYAHYQRRLTEQGALDFGDLISRAIELVRVRDASGRADVRDGLRRDYQHILVDEFQDVNYACGVLLKELAGDGRGLWAVGDVRQSIYRFRGAAPRNVLEFEATYPGARVFTLDVNYRAQDPVIATYAALAPAIRATHGQPFVRWTAHRPTTTAKVLVRVADDGAAEGDGIAREVERLRAEHGMAYRDQAVLCRSHLMLERIAARLEARGVPVLYLGDVFERPEVRDVLSVVALACEGDGRALVRVAEFPAYRVPLDDVQRLLRAAMEREVPFPRALALADDTTVGISAAGADALRRVRADVDDLCHGTSAWGLVSRFLFDRSAYLRPLLADASLAARQQRLALYQFLQFVHAHGGSARHTDDAMSGQGRTDGDAKRAFLRLVRRLAQHGDDRALRQVPEWAAELDAVRLMTVHASKGLQFPAVFVPGLAVGYFPKSNQGVTCPPPVGLLPAAVGDQRLEEEECLFFVALSRAEDVVCLSRAKRYSEARGSNPSPFLALIGAALPTTAPGAGAWAAVEPADVPPERPPPPAGERPVYDVQALDVYLQCPRRYFYERVLGLSGRREDSAYVRFHRCVYDVLHWARAERAAHGDVAPDAVTARLEETWARIGPRDHPYAALYEQAATALVASAMRRAADEGGAVTQPTWTVDLTYGRVRVTPDHVEVRATGAGAVVRVRRVRTGRPSKSEREKPPSIYGLYHAGATAAHPGAVPELEALYLTTDTVDAVPLKAGPVNTRLQHYDDAMAGIAAGAFGAKPSDRECPRCPQYFVCPLGQASGLAGGGSGPA